MNKRKRVNQSDRPIRHHHQRSSSLKKDIDENAQGTWGISRECWIRVCINDDVVEAEEIVRRLNRHNISLDAPLATGMLINHTMLTAAAACGGERIVELLLHESANPSAFDKSSPLHACPPIVHAIRFVRSTHTPEKDDKFRGMADYDEEKDKKCARIVRLLLGHGAKHKCIFPPTFASPVVTYCVPIVIAVRSGAKNTVRAFVDSPVGINNPKLISLNSGNEWLGTALHVAVQTDQLEIAQILLSHPRIDVNTQDMRYHQTPLHLAIERQTPNLKMVETLLKAGVDTSLSTRQVMTVLYGAEGPEPCTPLGAARAKHPKNEKLIAILLQYTK